MPSFDPNPLVGAETGEFIATPIGSLSSPSFEQAPLVGEPKVVEEPDVAVPVVDVETIRREGYEEGVAAGRAELPIHDVDALRSAAGALTEAAAALGSMRKTYLQAHRRAIAELAIAIASKLVGREIASDPDALGGIVARALELIDQPAGASLRLSVADYAVLEAGNAPELERLRGEYELRVESDSDLEAGDVRVSAGMVEVDARIVELLRRVREQLTEVLDVEDSPE